MNDRIIIVGGGVIGLALAWRLLKEGARVVVIDAGPAIPPATAAAAGMLAPSFEHGAGPVADALYRFSAASLERWRAFAEELGAASGRSIDYRPFGILGVVFEEAEAAALKRSFDELRSRGVAAEWLDGDEARRLEPALSPRIIAALHARQDAQVDPRRATAALQTVVTRNGGAIESGVVRAIRAKNGAVAGVALTDGRLIEAGRVVLAAGATASKIDIGAPPPPVFPVKGEAVALAAGKANLRMVVRAPGAYLCPKADGRLVIGATELRGDASLDPTPAGVEGLKRAGAGAFPASAAFPEVERWAGLRPGTPDGAPILGEVPGGPVGLFYALGHYRNGVLLAPETAEMLAPLILEDKEPDALAAFSASRFNH